MDPAENREQSPQANQPEESTNPPSLSKQEAIELLNQSIDKLEATIKDISDNSVQELPSPNSINNLLNTTQELADSVASPPLKDDELTVLETEAKIDLAATTAETKLNSVKSEPVKSNQTANQPANKPPQQSVAKKNNSTVKQSLSPPKKSSWKIIGAIAITITLVIAIWFGPPQLKIALAPDSEISEIALDQEIQPSPEVKTPSLPSLNPNDELEAARDQNLSTETKVIEAESEIIEPVTIPQDLTAPGRVKNLKIETIEPELTFTPEQTLVAAIQSKLAGIVTNYDPKLFNYVKVNLSATSLMLEVSDHWYELNSSRQEKLANEILKRSRQLNFSKVQFQDATGTLIARNPVVGDQIIMLRTSKND